MPLDEAIQKVLTINTTMETILQGLSDVCVYLDDIFITGKTNEEHLVNLSAVLHRLATVGMKQINAPFSYRK